MGDLISALIEPLALFVPRIPKTRVFLLMAIFEEVSYHSIPSAGILDGVKHYPRCLKISLEQMVEEPAKIKFDGAVGLNCFTPQKLDCLFAV